MRSSFWVALRSRSFFIVALGFATLIALIAILGLGAMRRARTLYAEMERAQNAYVQTEEFRRDIARDMYLADILVRDYLLDPSPRTFQFTGSNFWRSAHHYSSALSCSVER